MTLGMVAGIVWGIALIGTEVTRRWARRHLLDRPNARSSHRVATPRGGGLAVVLAIAIGWLLGGGKATPIPVVMLLVTATLSFVDDLRSLPASARLLAQVVIAAIVVLAIGPFREIVWPGLGSITWVLATAVLSAIWIVGLMNAYNFLDGIDGIAAIQGIVAGAAWWWIGGRVGIDVAQWGGAITAASCLGFLPFNWSPARIFLGDVGSVSLGFIFAVLPILASRSTGAAWAAPVGVLVVWPFLFDAAFTLVRRAIRGERIFEAHRSHLYQRLVIAGWSHSHVATLYGGLAVLTSVAALALIRGEWWAGWAAAALTSAVLLTLVRRVERRAAGL